MEILIVGKCKAQTQALAFYIENALKSNCVISESINHTFLNPSETSYAPRLILFDCDEVKQEELFDILNSFSRRSEKNWLVVFNLHSEVGFETKALKYGVKGFLYRHDSLETFIRAIETVFSDDVWVSRQKIAECLQLKTSTEKAIPDLTSREIEILKILAKGHSNEMIAEELNISPHTVKTHLSNIFKKINVHTRRNAIRWFKSFF